MAFSGLPHHRVVPGEDSRAYQSVRVRPISRVKRFELGRELRDKVSRGSLGKWRPVRHRPDPIAQIVRSHEGRLASLIPIRVNRMTASPYGFLRGATVVMTHDLSQLPATGITPVICGDAHLGNFGFYASPERNLVIDLNDFDEAHPGPWEWDLWRLVTSIWVAGRQNGSTEGQCGECGDGLRCRVSRVDPVSGESAAAVAVLSAPHRRSAEENCDGGFAPRHDRAGRSQFARTRTGDRTVPRLTTARRGRRRIVDEPPLITPVSGTQAERIARAVDNYLVTLPPHWRRVVAGYTLVDVAHKVVGVSSVGLRSYVAMLEGASPDDILFLQLKQARRSVAARYVHGELARHAHQGQRVVEYQQSLQTVSDPLLGWTTIEGLPYYVRQFRDMKGTIPIDAIRADALTDYARVLGQLLAKGHARTSGASMIAGYVGGSDRLDTAMTRFARAYADQVEADFEALVRAVRNGATLVNPVKRT